MSEAAIDGLDIAAQSLRTAMEGGDPDRLTEATTAFGAALDSLRGIDAWRADPALKDRLRGIMARLESDRHLSRLLGDIVRQRLDLLAGATADVTGHITYGRKG
ncbi:hypothetical protein LWE61_12380 [Sphingobium sufflavum]|uniref:hypothetical protein n=1 Tax=Sphingobium sufflavum TaxID=1129547 RepID=UPI001F424843|nr:hypothetical protein [Sphingobium sufflavum]MCE7797352.1 hypothetical protein [Sphingobium sufflavum]